MPRFAKLAALAAVLIVPGFAPAADKLKTIDIAICLDVSSSMDGLIDSAKIRLWDVVNEVAKVKPTPTLRVSLYSYGHDNYDAKAGWVRKEIDLTSDLDEVYAKLNGLKTGGGTELVARVARDAIKDQKWSTEANALKVIFVCGNEPVNQDRDVSLADVTTAAKAAGITINTIYCGRDGSGEATGWSEFASGAAGKYASINQDGVKTDIASTIKAPQDAKILELNEKLNKTYVAYGAAGKEKAEQQKAQDKLAGDAKAAPGAAPEAAVNRAAAKAGALYRNAGWDLVDRQKEDKDFDIRKLKEEELCDELKKLTPDERVAFVKKKAEERAAIQKQIQDLSTERAKYVAEEVKKAPQAPGEKALDAALKGIIREQAVGKGFEFEPAKK